MPNAGPAARVDIVIRNGFRFRALVRLQSHDVASTGTAPQSGSIDREPRKRILFVLIVVAFELIAERRFVHRPCWRNAQRRSITRAKGV